jgi:hypothetical protein
MVVIVKFLGPRHVQSWAPFLCNVEDSLNARCKMLEIKGYIAKTGEVDFCCDACHYGCPGNFCGCCWLLRAMPHGQLEQARTLVSCPLSSIFPTIFGWGQRLLKKGRGWGRNGRRHGEERQAWAVGAMVGWQKHTGDAK